MQKRLSEDTTLELELWGVAQNPQQKQMPQNGTLKNGGETTEEKKRQRWRKKRREWINSLPPKPKLAPKTHCKHGHALTPDNLQRQLTRNKIYWKCKKCVANARQRLKENKQRHYAKFADKYKQQTRARYAKNKRLQQLLARERSMRNLYGIDPETYAHMMNNQNLKCAVCEEGPIPRPYVDHDHATGKIRAIICHACNIGIGYLERRNGQWLHKALAYLKKHA